MARSTARSAAVRVEGHFGEILQGRLGADGPVALVTLACPAVSGAARFELKASATLEVIARGAALGVEGVARRAAAAALRRFGGSDVRGAERGGTLHLESGAAPGAGCGASTIAALTAIRAVAQALGAEASPDEEAALCLSVEGATDPLMHAAPGALLWASRDGRVLRALPPPPAFEVLGVLDGPGAPTDPSSADFADVSDLAARLEAAFAAGDRAAIGAVATESARRNGRDRALPRFPALLELARRAGAEGVAAAHTGSAAALLFAPGAPGAAAAEAGLKDLGWPAPLRFNPARSAGCAR